MHQNPEIVTLHTWNILKLLTYLTFTTIIAIIHKTQLLLTRIYFELMISWNIIFIFFSFFLLIIPLRINSLLTKYLITTKLFWRSIKEQFIFIIIPINIYTLITFLLSQLYSIEYNRKVLRWPLWVLTLWELVSQRWKKLISFCNFQVEGIDALNSWKPDLGHKTGNCGLQGPKRGQKSIGQCVFIYLPAFRNHRSQRYEIRNLSSI